MILIKKLRLARLLPLALSAAVFLLANGSIFAQASPVGRWKTIDDETGRPKSIIVIWEAGGMLYGRIEQLLNTEPGKEDPLCDKCEGALYNKKVIGMTIMNNLRRDGNEWSGGTILDPKKGKLYNCKIWLESANVLKVRGYVAFFYRTQTWYRVP